MKMINWIISIATLLLIGCAQKKSNYDLKGIYLGDNANFAVKNETLGGFDGEIKSFTNSEGKIFRLKWESERISEVGENNLELKFRLTPSQYAKEVQKMKSALEKKFQIQLNSKHKSILIKDEFGSDFQCNNAAGKYGLTSEKEYCLLFSGNNANLVIEFITWQSFGSFYKFSVIIQDNSLFSDFINKNNQDF